MTAATPVCAQCGAALTGRRVKWCSEVCFVDSRRVVPLDRNCKQCGKRLEGKQLKFCGAECYNKDLRERIAQRPNENKCRRCGKQLTGRQIAWCSARCTKDFETESAYINNVRTLLRRCRTCGLQKPLKSDFYPAGGGYRRNCRACVMADNTERLSRPDVADRSRRNHLRGLYGITPEQYELMLQAQGGKCAVCEKPPMSKRLSVDHDHRTHLIRGLLCNFCNLRIVGRVTDSRLYHRAAEYLDDPPAVAVIGLHRVPMNPPKRRRSRRKKAA